MSKVTLSIDESVIRQAKRYARSRGLSVSKMVETYLGLITEPMQTTDDPPVLRSLRGILHRADPADHKRHLQEKYR